MSFEPKGSGENHPANHMNTATLVPRKNSAVPNARRTSPMINRPTLKKAASDDEQHAPTRPTRQAQNRFVLKIDGQAKSSFVEKEAAMKAAREITMKYPVVKAAIYDSQEGTNEFC